nr:hypothetical protein GCM10020092_080000 [Actinoplanes digitatis]
MPSLGQRLAELTPEQRLSLATRLAVQDRVKTYPMSSMQRRLWFLERLTPGTTAYVVPAAVRMRGALDHTLLRGVVAELVHRHESLRTTFEERDGVTVQVVAPRAVVEMSEEDLRGLPAPELETARSARIVAEISAPFDIAAGPLLRLRLLRTADDEHILVIVLHHIVSDGWSVSVLFAEFAALYAAFAEGRPSPLPPLEIQYGQVAQLEESAEDLHYWTRRLAGAPPVLELALDHPRPPAQSFHGASWHFDLPAMLVGDLAAARPGSRRHAVHGPVGPVPGAPVSPHRAGRRGRRHSRGQPWPGRARRTHRVLRQHPAHSYGPLGRPVLRRAAGARA